VRAQTSLKGSIDTALGSAPKYTVLGTLSLNAAPVAKLTAGEVKLDRRFEIGAIQYISERMAWEPNLQRPYHTRQAFSATIGCPGLHLNACWKAAEFCTAPFTRQRPGECESVSTRLRAS